MDKKIKVHLQYPWSFPDSSYYKSILKYPPKNVEFVNSKQDKFKGISSGRKFKFMGNLKHFARKILTTLKVPNLIKTKQGDYDLIHCAHCLSINKKPWVVDVEKYWNFSASYQIAHSKIGKNRIKKMLKSPYCKKIIAWTEAAKKSITDSLKDKEIEDKIELVSFAVPVQKFKKKKKKNITLLFVGRYFNSKGGLQALKIIDILTKKYPNVGAIFVSTTPEQIIKKYSQNKKIKFYDLMPQEKLFEIYKKSDIFVYPGFSDSFGFANVEAMSFGLVVLGVNRFARRDIITDKKTGFIIKIPPITYKKGTHPHIQDGIPIIPNEEKMIKDFVDKASLLIENKKLMGKMSNAARKEIENGKFSIKQRNKILKKIYRNALK